MNLMTPFHASMPSGLNCAHSPAELAQSLIGDVRNLNLVGHATSDLKAFTELVITHVQTLDAFAVIEEYSSGAFLPLISRLNQEVAPHLLAHTASSATPGPAHIWVIHQADALSTQQQSVIFRLIALFPVLSFRVIWLSKQPLAAWQHGPTANNMVVDLDANVPHHQKQALSTPPAKEALTDTLAWPAATFISPHMKAAYALIGAAVLCTWVWLSAPHFGPSAAATDKRPATAIPPSTQPAHALTPVMTPERPATALAESSAPVSEDPRKNKSPPGIAQTNAQWLLSLPTDSFVVEHGTFNTWAQAQNFQTKHKALSTAYIIAVRKTPNAENWQFSVVTGHFRSEDRAKRYVSRLEWRVSARIRATEKLKPLVVSVS